MSFLKRLFGRPSPETTLPAQQHHDASPQKVSCGICGVSIYPSTYGQFGGMCGNCRTRADRQQYWEFRMAKLDHPDTAVRHAAREELADSPSTIVSAAESLALDTRVSVSARVSAVQALAFMKPSSSVVAQLDSRLRSLPNPNNHADSTIHREGLLARARAAAIAKADALPFLCGIYGEVSRQDVLTLNTEKALGLLLFSVMLTKAEGTLCCIELLFKDYASDSRALHDIPEIAAWSTKVSDEYPHFLAVLAPGSMFCFLRSTVVQPAEATQHSYDLKVLMLHFVVAGGNLQERLKLDKVDPAVTDRIASDFQRNFQMMLKGTAYLLDQKALLRGTDGHPDAATLDRWREIGVVLG
jgi:hypothetical protein